MSNLLQENHRVINRPVRIVIADDHPGFRAGVASFIKAYPDRFQIVGEAETGYEAYRLCKQLRPDIAILDLTYSQGGPSGTEVIASLQQENLGIKIVVLTGDPLVDVKSLEKRGIDRCLDKTASFGVIIETLEAVARNPPTGSVTRSTVVGETRVRSTNSYDVPVRDQIRELTNREIDILLELAKGGSNNDIAQALYITARTVGTHLRNIYSKLGLTNRTAAALFVSQHHEALVAQQREI